MAGKRSAEVSTKERTAQICDNESLSRRPKGDHSTSDNQNLPGEVGYRNIDEGVSDMAGGQITLADKAGNSGVISMKSGSADGFLHGQDESESLDSDVGSDLLTNVEGRNETPSAKRLKLTGVMIVDDNEAENIGMKNVAKLLRRQRYHDDDISQAAAPPRISMSRCFRCLLPGHMARDCPNPAKEKPCTNCAGYGHNQFKCPKSMCYRCDGFGHLASDCPNSAAVTDARVCVRCGKTDCPASGGTDWHRVHHGCRQEYSAVDVKHVRCFVCGKQGHFCCEATPLEPVHFSCCLCGGQGHTGFTDLCPNPLPKFLRAEAHQAQRRREDSSRSARGRTGDDRRNGNVYDDMGHHYRSGPTRLDSGRSGSGFHVRQTHLDQGWYAQGGLRARPGAAAQPTAGLPHVTPAAASNRYGPQRYGYGPVDPQPVQNPSYNTERRRRGFHGGTPAQQVHSPSQPYAMASHPPPDMLASGGHAAGGAYSAGGNHGRSDAAAVQQGGHVVILQGNQAWQMQQHDITMQRQQPNAVASGGQVNQQHPHAGRVRQPYTELPFYMKTSTGQGTYRRWA